MLICGIDVMVVLQRQTEGTNFWHGWVHGRMHNRMEFMESGSEFIYSRKKMQMVSTNARPFPTPRQCFAFYTPYPCDMGFRILVFFSGGAPNPEEPLFAFRSISSFMMRSASLIFLGCSIKAFFFPPLKAFFFAAAKTFFGLAENPIFRVTFSGTAEAGGASSTILKVCAGLHVIRFDSRFRRLDRCRRLNMLRPRSS